MGDENPEIRSSQERGIACAREAVNVYVAGILAVEGDKKLSMSGSGTSEFERVMAREFAVLHFQNCNNTSSPLPAGYPPLPPTLKAR